MFVRDRAKNPNVNLSLITEQGLRDVTTTAYAPVDITDAQLPNVVTNCASIVRKRTVAAGYSEYDAPNYLDACTHLDYLVVLRAAGSGPTENAKAGTFVGGMLVGDVLVSTRSCRGS